MTLAPAVERPVPGIDPAWHAAAHDIDLPRRLRGGELRLLAALATGAPLTAVSQGLGISERTVRRHIRNLCDELGVRTPIEAVAWAARRRLI